jgi:ribosome-associated protein
MDIIKNRNFSKEWFFRTSRSSGKGGQNVNKLSTKVELCFNVNNSFLLNQEEKELIKERFGKRISLTGLLRISSEKERSQLANKRIVIEKFRRLIDEALELPEKRISTKPTLTSVVKRKINKKKISEKKYQRKLILKIIDKTD